MHLVTVATCSLNQWVLDWEGNLRRIKESILLAKQAGASLRVGPELEICGYGCLDHFKERDTYLHCWQMLKKLLEDKECYDIMLDVGMPVEHRAVLYNCRIIALNGKIILIRPKQALANDLNYFEARYFTPWLRRRELEEYYLPRMIQKLQGATTVPFGDAIIATRDTVIGAETCEEAFIPDPPHVAQTLCGCEIITNSSGSHHELRKLDVRLNLILEGTRKTGGIYLYANQGGCDGDRLGYDRCAMIAVNGKPLNIGPQFALTEVDVVTATVDLEKVRSYRRSPSRGLQATMTTPYPRIFADFSLSNSGDLLDIKLKPTKPIEIKYHVPEEEIALGPAVWLWDYIRRSGAAGVLLPLSGGLDSCSVATIVFSMCREVFKAIKQGNATVLKDCRRIAGAYKGPDWIPKTPQEICNKVFHTVYLGMEIQSSPETRNRAKELSEAIGSYHLDTNIDPVFKAFKTCLFDATGFQPKFKSEGGSPTENLALQNIQARGRMVLSYQYAQLIPTIRHRPGGGSLLVLSAGNLEGKLTLNHFPFSDMCLEQLRGYMTKYDCSSADLNLIGSISKIDLIKFLKWAKVAFDLPCLEDFINATPTAELEPITADYVQSDEIDMGFTYEELSTMGRLRKQDLLGPYSMFEELLHTWEHKYSPREIATKVKNFHHYYAINRHKTTVLTPSYHAESYSCDSHRFDLRPHLLPPYWSSWASKAIDGLLDQVEKENTDIKTDKESEVD